MRLRKTNISRKMISLLSVVVIVISQPQMAKNICSSLKNSKGCCSSPAKQHLPETPTFSAFSRCPCPAMKADIQQPADQTLPSVKLTTTVLSVSSESVFETHNLINSNHCLLNNHNLPPPSPYTCSERLSLLNIFLI